MVLELFTYMAVSEVSSAKNQYMSIASQVVHGFHGQYPRVLVYTPGDRLYCCAYHKKAKMCKQYLIAHIWLNHIIINHIIINHNGSRRSHISLDLLTIIIMLDDVLHFLFVKCPVCMRSNIRVEITSELYDF